jgi:hypothetical protein
VPEDHRMSDRDGAILARRKRPKRTRLRVVALTLVSLFLMLLASPALATAGSTLWVAIRRSCTCGGSDADWIRDEA